MKRMFFAVLLLVAISTALFSREFVASGQTNSAMGAYRIEKADNPVTINGEQLTTYVISYQNSPLQVTVAVQKDKKCKNYIVLSGNLSVKYVCNGDFLGVQKLEKDLKIENAGFVTSDEALDKSEYFHQKLIVQGKQTEIASTQFIATYFPMLIKDEMLALN